MEPWAAGMGGFSRRTGPAACERPCTSSVRGKQHVGADQALSVARCIRQQTSPPLASPSDTDPSFVAEALKPTLISIWSQV